LYDISHNLTKVQQCKTKCNEVHWLTYIHACRPLCTDEDPITADYDETSIRYRGRTNPSKTFRLLQSATGSDSDSGLFITFYRRITLKAHTQRRN